MIRKSYKNEFALLCSNKAIERYNIGQIEGLFEKTQTAVCGAADKNCHILFLMAHEVIEYCKSKNIPYGSGFTSGFHLPAYFLGISEVNPLPLHYECECGAFEWIESDIGKDKIYADGFDMPDKICPECGTAIYAASITSDCAIFS